MRFIHLITITLLCIGVSMKIAGLASAGNFQITPSIDITESYNDNILFLPDNAVDDYITTINIGLEGSNRTERLNLKYRGALLPFYYQSRDDLNDVDMDYKAKVDYQLTPRFSLNAKGAYRVDNRPDREIDATGLVFDSNQRQRYRAGAGINYELTETNILSLSYTYDQDDWEGTSPSIDLKDYEGQTISLRYTHNISRWLRESLAFINAGYGTYDYDSSDSKSLYANIGLLMMISEIFQTQISIGGRHTDSDFIDQSIVPNTWRSNSSSSAIGTIGISYLGERTTSNLTVSQDLRSASGTQGPANLTKAILEIDHRMFEKLSIGISTRYFLNKSDANEFSATPTDLKTYHIRPKIRWQFSNSFNLEGGYHYARLKNDISGTKSDRNIVYLQLGFSMSLFDIVENISTANDAVGPAEQEWPDLR